MLNLFTASLRIISSVLNLSPRKPKAMPTPTPEESFEERDCFTIDVCPDPYSLHAMLMIAAQRTKANAMKQPFVAGFVGFHGEKYLVSNEMAPATALAYVDAELDMQQVQVKEMHKLLQYVENQRGKAGGNKRTGV
jgi:hypothetical protein